jgi:two-component system, LytTR family, sensor kinase
MSAMRSNGALWQSGEHRIPTPPPTPRGEPGRLAAVEMVALRRELSRLRGRAVDLERRLAAAEAEAVTAQLTPHFLCNSLQAVSALLHRDTTAADAMVLALSDFLRQALRVAPAAEVPLARELATVSRYVDVMRFRFGTGLRFVSDVSPETRDALVPQLLLQPLVENAIVHGFADRAGTIRVSAERRGGMLRCAVSDDGRGLGPGSVVERIGLGGTRQRLRAMYGDRYRFDLAGNASGGGVTIELALPYRVATHESEERP